MADYTDFALSFGPYGKATEYTDENAIILAIRNILLSRPGNFPFNPSIGMNIKKYQFDILDSQTISDIQSELNREIAQYIPNLGSVEVYVNKIESSDGIGYLGISVGANLNGEKITSNFIMGQDPKTNEVKVFNEIN